MLRFTLATAATLAVGTMPAHAQDAPPNVLLIIADDMGIEASNCYDLGDQQAPMPVIESLCAEGMVFDNAYSAPTCSPTRATIMSGQYGFRTGVGAPIDRDGSDSLSADTVTIFDAIAPTGYASNLIGKWHITGTDLGYDMPAEMGVSDYFGLYSGGVRDYWDWTAIEDGQEVQVDDYATTVFTDRAIDWIGAQEEPWFLWLAYNAPHSPFHLPPTDLHSFDDLPDDQDAVDENPLPYYHAMLEALDTEIGRLLDAMPEDERENTIVVFIGDNGSPNQVIDGFFGDHDAKGTIYDSGTNVPFIVAGPGVDAGRTDSFVNTTDIYATVASLTGAESTAPDSIDFSPVLAGEPGVRTFINVDHFTNRETKGGGLYGWALREGDYKLVSPEGQPEELYDVVNDPLEQTNLLADGSSEDFAEIVSDLMARRESITEEAN